MNKYFDFVRCTFEGCSGLALTGEGVCAVHHPDIQAFRQKVLVEIQNGNSLSGWVLGGVNFSKQNLRETDLTSAYLKECTFDSADLSGARLARAHAEHASFRHANLEKANLEFAILGRADFTHANLTGANLSRSNLVGAIGRQAILRDVDLFYCRAGVSDFSEADFTGANIERAVFRRAFLINTILSGARGKANFDMADLGGMENHSKALIES